MRFRQRITPFLWFDDRAEEAARLYVSIFPNSRIATTTRYTEEGARVAGRAPGSVMTVAFELDGQEFIALNGGPMFTFTEALSLVVHCETQAEVDHYWSGLGAGGEEQPCGWLKDRFGLSWQVVPAALIDLIQDEDPERAKRAIGAMLTMKKLDIAALTSAAAGR